MKNFFLPFRSTTQSKIFLIAISSIFFFQSFSYGQNEKIEEQNLLIKKIESLAKEDLSDQMLEKKNILLRLANLYAERARLLSLDKEGKGSEVHKKEITSDRSKAVKIYTDILAAESNSSKDNATSDGSIALQAAHLYILLNQEPKALNIYREIEKNRQKYPSDVLSVAILALAEVDFDKGEFPSAKKRFLLVEQIEPMNSSKNIYAKYRTTWCDLNSGKNTDAIAQLELLLDTKTNLDAAFREQASHDLATFYSHPDPNSVVKVTDEKVKKLIEVSPPSSKNRNLNYLAEELDRTSRKREALLVWSYIPENEKSAKDKIENQVRITQIEYDLGNKKKTNLEATKAIELIKGAECAKSTHCATQTKVLRKIVTDWGKAEEYNPSEELVQMYKQYGIAFLDLNILYWGALAAEKRKSYSEAVELYSLSTLVSTSKNNKNDLIFQVSLLGAIRNAESSKDFLLREKAYKHYLRFSPNGKQSYEVKYQLAHISYEKSLWSDAIKQFSTIVKNSSAPLNLRIKSADLCLDSVALLKDDELMEDLSLDYALILPARRKEFTQMAFVSIINQAKNHNDDKNKILKIIEKLKKMNRLYLSDENRILANQNLSILAFKLYDLESIETASKALLKIKKISKEDREQALKTLAWIYELKMNFSAALDILKQVKNTPDFKLGLLAELSGKNPVPYYQNIINSGLHLKKTKKMLNDDTERAYALHQLIYYTKSKEIRQRLLSKYGNILNHNLDFLSSAVLLAHGENPPMSITRRINKTQVGLLIHRKEELIRMEAMITKIRSHKLSSGKDLNKKIANQLARSIKERVHLISKIESLTQKAIQKSDWTLQLVGLTHLALENRRLSKEVVNLPVPNKWSIDQKNQYKEQLRLQSQTFEEKYLEIYNKIRELWVHKEYLDSLIELSLRKEMGGSIIAKNELEKIKMITHIWKWKFNDIEILSQSRQKMLRQAEIMKFDIMKNPFDINKIEEMVQLQKQIGSGIMVAYFESRRMQLFNHSSQRLAKGYHK